MHRHKPPTIRWQTAPRLGFRFAQNCFLHNLGAESLLFHTFIFCAKRQLVQKRAKKGQNGAMQRGNPPTSSAPSANPPEFHTDFSEKVFNLMPLARGLIPSIFYPDKHFNS